jgi:site-specific DNA-methyltransferase (adenine-specific)
MKELLNKIHLMDCMDLMAKLPDKSIDIAIVDPPYGIERNKNKTEKSNRFCKNAKMNKWDKKPDQKYFEELFRVSKFQIIWGANNFQLPTTEYFIVWDKWQTVDNFASAEYAWTNVKKPAQIFRHSIHKCMQERKKEGGKIHPTQKPVALYCWLLQNYAKEEDLILDTHCGSGSSVIACIEGKFNYIACEIDGDYHKASIERIQPYLDQGKLF